MRQHSWIICLSLAALLAGALVSNANAQERKIEIAPFAGYQWVTDTYTSGGYLDTKDGVNYGGAIDFTVQRDLQLELLYIYYDTQTQFRSESYSYPSSSGYTDLAMHYMQIGYVKGFKKGKIEPFGAFTLGAVLFVPSTFELENGMKVTPSDTWRFAMTFGGGAKIFFSDKLGIRLQARLLVPVYFSGAGVYVGTGGGGMAVTGGIPALMGDFTAGIIFAP
jgi:hypothetical protein